MEKLFSAENWGQSFRGEEVDRTIHAIRSERSHEERSYIRSAYQRFKRFGPVDTIRAGCADCLFIQYKHAEDVAKVLKIGLIDIDHSDFRIFSADRFHDQITGCCTHSGHVFADETFICTSTGEDPSKNILFYLIDDCLREIFRKIHSFVDFCNATNVCERFNAIAMEIFPSKIRRRTFSLDQLVVDGDVTLLLLENFLTTFGASVQVAYLNFDGVRFENVPNAIHLALGMFNNYCRNLQSLHIVIGNYENGIDWLAIHSVLPNLKHLKIDIEGVKNFDLLADFISVCCLLETLIINYGYDLKKKKLVLPEITFPKLVKFKLSCTSTEVRTFLKHNTQLEKICISGWATNPFDGLRSIEGLNMSNLRKLTLDSCTFSGEREMLIAKSFGENVRIKLDALCLYDGGELMTNFWQLKNITTVCLEIWPRYPDPVNHLISLAQSQKTLRKLTLYISDEKIRCPLDLIKSMLSYAEQLAEINLVSRYGFGPSMYKDFEEISRIIERRHNPANLNINLFNQHQQSHKDPCRKWKKEKMILFNDDANRLSIVGIVTHMTQDMFELGYV